MQNGEIMTVYPAGKTDVPLLQSVQADGITYTSFYLMDASV